MQSKQQFITENIDKINATNAANFIKIKSDEGISPFPNLTEVKYFLKETILRDVNTKKILLSTLWEDFKTHNFTINKIVDIANKHLYFEKDVREILEREVKLRLIKRYNEESFYDLIKNLKNGLNNEDNKENGYRLIKSDVEKSITDFLYFALQGGFPVNLQEINSGIMTSNAGDSAQFLFLARAILAGFNCSNVDVRSSRYDVVMDYRNKLLRIQVKGISKGSTISFYDRPRGGQGIDHTHERNLGKRITGTDCDFYVAVDKRSGLCYIIPMSYADALSDDDIGKVKLADLKIYKENWKIFGDFENTKEKKLSDKITKQKFLRSRSFKVARTRK